MDSTEDFSNESFAHGDDGFDEDMEGFERNYGGEEDLDEYGGGETGDNYVGYMDGGEGLGVQDVSDKMKRGEGLTGGGMESYDCSNAGSEGENKEAMNDGGTESMGTMKGGMRSEHGFQHNDDRHYHDGEVVEDNQNVGNEKIDDNAAVNGQLSSEGARTVAALEDQFGSALTDTKKLVESLLNGIIDFLVETESVHRDFVLVQESVHKEKLRLDELEPDVERASMHVMPGNGGDGDGNGSGPAYFFPQDD